jgi:hypothetical protein
MKSPYPPLEEGIEPEEFSGAGFTELGSVDVPEAGNTEYQPSGTLPAISYRAIDAVPSGFPRAFGWEVFTKNLYQYGKDTGGLSSVIGFQFGLYNGFKYRVFLSLPANETGYGTAQIYVVYYNGSIWVRTTIASQLTSVVGSPFTNVRFKVTRSPTTDYKTWGFKCRAEYSGFSFEGSFTLSGLDFLTENPTHSFYGAGKSGAGNYDYCYVAGTYQADASNFISPNKINTLYYPFNDNILGEKPAGRLII